MVQPPLNSVSTTVADVKAAANFRRGTSSGHACSRPLTAGHPEPFGACHLVPPEIGRSEFDVAVGIAFDLARSPT